MDHTPYRNVMITLQFPDAQRELPTLADKALRGEQVFIVVGQKTLQLEDRAGFASR